MLLVAVLGDETKASSKYPTEGRTKLSGIELPKESRFVGSLDSLNSEIRVSGRVTDSNGEPLPGVTVLRMTVSNILVSPDKALETSFTLSTDDD